MAQGSQKYSIALLAALFWLAACERSVESSAGQTIGVASVIDGDSLTIGQTKIRLWGIDAVELYQTCQRNETFWDCGKAAKQALIDTINGQPLACHQKDIDRYGRSVAECFAGEINLNAWMVRYGWALAYRRYTRQYIKDEKAAKAEQLGIWQSQFTEPWKWRRQ